MSLSFSILPVSSDLEMFGRPDSTSAYTLSGHIAVSFTTPYSFFQFHRNTRLLLQSLVLTFEGQSEVYTPDTGYSAIRLCNISNELITAGEPIELSNERSEEEPCLWNITFNLPIPGWLPASALLGVSEIGVKYALYATARYTLSNEESTGVWSLCSPFQSRYKTAAARQAITLTRFINAPKPGVSEAPTSNFLIKATSHTRGLEGGRERIPSEVLDKIQVLATVPDFVNVEGHDLDMMIRMRTKGLEEEHCKKLQLTDVEVDVVQHEKFRRTSSPSYTYPLPPKNMQPPHMALLDPHPVSSMWDNGLFGKPGRSEAVMRSFSLLPSYEPGKYKMDPNNYIFADDGNPETSESWYTMSTKLPFTHRSRSSGRDSSEWGGRPILRPNLTSPLLGITHELSITLICTYDLDNGNVAREKLSFKLPLLFARVACRSPLYAIQQTLSDSSVVAAAQPVVSLPAYSQLYDREGYRRVDETVPLPVYTPKSKSSKNALGADELSPLMGSSEDDDAASDGQPCPAKPV